MNYYIFIENGKINGCGQAQILNEEIQNIEVSEDVFNAFVEDNLKYIWNGSEIVENPCTVIHNKKKEVIYDTASYR